MHVTQLVALSPTTDGGALRHSGTLAQSSEVATFLSVFTTRLGSNDRVPESPGGKGATSTTVPTTLPPTDGTTVEGSASAAADFASLSALTDTKDAFLGAPEIVFVVREPGTKTETGSQNDVASNQALAVRAQDAPLVDLPFAEVDEPSPNETAFVVPAGWPAGSVSPAPNGNPGPWTASSAAIPPHHAGNERWADGTGPTRPDGTDLKTKPHVTQIHSELFDGPKEVHPPAAQSATAIPVPGYPPRDEVVRAGFGPTGRVDFAPGVATGEGDVLLAADPAAVPVFAKPGSAQPQQDNAQATETAPPRVSRLVGQGPPDLSGQSFTVKGERPRLDPAPGAGGAITAPVGGPDTSSVPITIPEWAPSTELSRPTSETKLAEAVRLSNPQRSDPSIPTAPASPTQMVHLPPEPKRGAGGAIMTPTGVPDTSTVPKAIPEWAPSTEQGRPVAEAKLAEAVHPSNPQRSDPSVPTAPGLPAQAATLLRPQVHDGPNDRKTFTLNRRDGNNEVHAASSAEPASAHLTSKPSTLRQSGPAPNLVATADAVPVNVGQGAISGDFGVAEVRAGEPSAQVPETSVLARPETPRQIAVQIAEVTRGPGERAVEITLQPEELGRVGLTMKSENGGLSVVLTIERPETLDLVRRHIEMLSDELRRAGYDSVDISFRNGGQNGGRESHERGDASNNHETPVAHGDAATEPEPANRRHGRDGVDIRL